jgi:hypothetical protein
MLGAVAKAQVAEAVFVTRTEVQLSLPVAVTALLTEQVSMGAVKLAVKLAEAPGASVRGPMTGVLGAGWLFTTSTLFNVTLPELRTVPLKVIEAPAAAGTAGHASETAMAGAVVTAHVVETVFVTAVGLQTSLPVPLKVVVTEQALVGTV